MEVYLVCTETVWDYEGGQCEHEMMTGSLDQARDLVEELKQKELDALKGHGYRGLKWHKTEEDVWELRWGVTTVTIRIEYWSL